MIILLLLNSLVIFTSCIFASRILKIDEIADFLIAALLLYFAEIAIIEMFLGMANLLYINNVFIAVSFVFLVAWHICGRPNRLGAPMLGKGAAGELSRDKGVLLLISIIAVYGLAKTAINLMHAPFGWDSLNYHFTFAVEWFKNGSLVNPITVSDDPSPPYYPINGSLYYLWLILPLKNVFIADLGQLPFFVLTFLATFGISRKLGLTRTYAFYASGLFLIIPNFFKQLSIAYVDVMVASLYLASFYFLLRLHAKFSGKYALLFGISLGLCLGTKTTALPFSVLLLFPFIILCVRNAPKLVSMTGCFIIIMILGGFSYIRNYFMTGNPLFPLDFNLLGHNIFHGVMPQEVYRAHFKIEDYRLSKLLFHEGLGVQSLLFILPGIFLALPISIIKRKKISIFSLYLFILPFLMYFIYRYVIPLANVRYLYALLGIGMVYGFLCLQYLKIPPKAVKTGVILCCLSSMAELAKRQELVFSMIMAFVCFALLIVFGKKLKGGFFNLRKVSFVLPVFLLIAAILVIGQKQYLKNEFSSYKKMVKYSGFWPDATVAWEWLNDNTSGNNIAYIGRPVPFPLYGSGFKNNVYYVSVNKVEPAYLHSFPSGRYSWGYDFSSLHSNLEAEGNYRGQAEYQVWLSNLLSRQTDFLFIYSLHQIDGARFPVEDNWVVMHPEQFSLVFSNETIRIYKVLK